MAMVASALKASLLTLYESCSEGEGLTADEFAEQMANIIDAYIKTATVTGTAAVTSAPGTAPVTGALS